MAQSTPGKWFNYFSSSLSTTTPIVALTVPSGYNFYLNYLSFVCFTVIETGCVLYCAIDNIPIVGLTASSPAEIVQPSQPLIFSNTMSIGILGPLGAFKSFVVTYDGEVQ